VDRDRHALDPEMSSPPMHAVSHIISQTLKVQNRLKVGTDKPKLKVKMQSVSDDDVRKILRKKPRFELVSKGVFRLGRCYIFRQGVCDFLLVYHSNLGPILHRFGATARFIVLLTTPLSLGLFPLDQIPLLGST